MAAKCSKKKKGIFIRASISGNYVISIDAPNNRVPKYMKQKLIELKENLDISSITLGDFNISVSVSDRTIQKFSMDIQDVNKRIRSN